MNIKPITPKKINYVEIKQRKNTQKDTKNTLKKAAVITGAISAAALIGMLIVKKTNLLNKISSLSNKHIQTPNKNEFFDAFHTKSNKTNTQIIRTTLPNGIEKIDKINKSTLYGTTQKTKLSRPINGVKAIETYTFPNGDISKVSAFDASGNIIKNIQYNYLYASKKGLSSVHTTTAAGETKIDFEYLRHLPEKVKSVNITYPDGTTKFTLIPHSLKDKLAELIHR